MARSDAARNAAFQIQVAVRRAVQGGSAVLRTDPRTARASLARRRWPSPRISPGPRSTVLHRVVRENLETFLREAADRTDGGGLPRFVEREFREFLTCGALGRGFARVRCENCAFERLVPFSCKRRGFCPSCGGRRMAEQAAHLVDHVLPTSPCAPVGAHAAAPPALSPRLQSRALP